MATRKDFEQTARIIRQEVESLGQRMDAQEIGARSVLESLAKEFARVYKMDYPRFDFDRFMRACGF